MMKILFLGDVVGISTVGLIREELSDIRKELGCDFVLANGENASNIFGIGASEYESLVYSGVDFITTGNHVWGKYDTQRILEEKNDIIRPLNYPATLPGKGASVVSVNGVRVLVMNVSGVAFMEPLDNPFDAVDKALYAHKGKYDISILDIHAEATAEKMAIANCFDGRINIIVGTHTHVQTADERVFPKGSAYITDLGMCGPINSIIGVKTEAVIRKQRYHMPSKFEVADGPIRLCGALIDINEENGRILSISRYSKTVY